MITLFSENKSFPSISHTRSHKQYPFPFTRRLEEHALRLPMVTTNGCEIWNAGGTLLHRSGLPLERIRYLRSLAIEHNIRYQAYATDGWYGPEHYPSDPERREWLMMLLRSTERTQLDKLRRLLEECGEFELSMSSPEKLDINPPGVSKAAAAAFVCARYGFDPSRVVVINDAALLRWAGLGIAPDNAMDEVKQAANAVTASNDEDGVALAIEALLGGRPLDTIRR